MSFCANESIATNVCPQFHNNNKVITVRAPVHYVCSILTAWLQLLNPRFYAFPCEEPPCEAANAKNLGSVGMVHAEVRVRVRVRVRVQGEGEGAG